MLIGCIEFASLSLDVSGGKILKNELKFDFNSRLKSDPIKNIDFSSSKDNNKFSFTECDLLKDINI